MNFDKDKFGKALREYRGHDTLLTLANKVGVEESTIQRIEKGQKPSVDTLYKILYLADWDYKNFITNE